MANLFETIQTFLSQQPWWLIALVTAGIVTLVNKKVGVTNNVGVKPKRSFGDKLGAASQPMSVETSNSQSVRIVSNNATFGATPGTNIKSAEISFEGDDAQELHGLIRAGNKVGAIKFIRQKKGLELIDAKNIVDAMSKFPQS